MHRRHRAYLGLLAVSVGPPYFVLSATGPLVQAWFCRSLPGCSPYRLYALSNLGSLVALLGYPFYLEPHFAVGRQAGLWAAGFALFAIVCGLAAFGAARPRCASREPAARHCRTDFSRRTGPLAQRSLAWLALPALASLMLLATTNHVCQDVAVMPFLWVAPLSLYLLSFIICFDHPALVLAAGFAVAALVLLAAVMTLDQLITGGSGVAASFVQELALQFSALFCLCMVCHGELVRLRPDPRFLTSFYLMISAGGALGDCLSVWWRRKCSPRSSNGGWGWSWAACSPAESCSMAQPRSFFRRRFALVAATLLIGFVGLSCVPQFQAASGPRTLRHSPQFLRGSLGSGAGRRRSSATLL